MCVTNVGFKFSSVQRSHWECDGGLLGTQDSPIVSLTSGQLTISTHLLQRMGRIWSRPATVKHPDTARLQHIVSTNTTQTGSNSSVSVKSLSGCFLFVVSKLMLRSPWHARCETERKRSERYILPRDGLGDVDRMVSQSWHSSNAEYNLGDTWYHIKKMLI